MDLQKFAKIPKLNEFIQNEINILKSIDNLNIIKLIEVLKTQNNYNNNMNEGENKNAIDKLKQFKYLL